ncbi:siroheme decarboxylase subunit beta [Thiolapillus brandeum]|uniref:siroheme decarboxylase n=1 Tax=Thiolapillus brandeum TaxID=1076588 RepID=A0A7U6GKZ2_9GAMM|nr:AsnC family transcriptional regulator [Thiolapillus brandeum]BAO45587.1 heme d1 biosynthesis protein NirH [Thiolapillus brandeum]
MDKLDRAIIAATQAGLPLDTRPYAHVAEQVGSDEATVMARMQAMQASGIIRRIGAVPNHYVLGFRGNGMSVWEVPENRIQACGEMVGSLDFVSHAYHRPKHPPLWNYNLFAMVHGRDREEVMQKVEKIAALLGENDLGHEVLFSTRILKKTGLRLPGEKA